MTPQQTPQGDGMDLLPCPFCGENAVTKLSASVPPTLDELLTMERDARCSSRACGGYDVQMSVSDWNRRSTPTPTPGVTPSPTGPSGQEVREALGRIGHNLRTQDNRITEAPIFIVEQVKQLSASEDSDLWEWRSSDDGEQIEDEDRIAKLEEMDDLGDSTPGYFKAYYQEIWQFVTACFTEQGCKDYLKVNGHNLKRPRIYAASGFRNAEWIAMREFLISRPAAAITPKPKD